MKGNADPLIVGLPEGTSKKMKLTVWPYGAGAPDGPSYDWLLEADVFVEATERKGAQQRLRNLGYPGVEATGEEDAPTARALGRLQTACDHEQPDGTLDEPTARFIEALYFET